MYTYSVSGTANVRETHILMHVLKKWRKGRQLNDEWTLQTIKNLQDVM